ncbi:sensor histidine kinase [Rhodospirillum centenum]|uniref:histidine kinase n=1 Tax=Rhodospirillum centenum (strain ATCC 51521 / SW) TaxID=414684 RepID=B6ISH8_RHOCS|nr:sensor histidine kinase [Rhodospirillum centenum]ACI98414.1 sensor histidine kinase, putative [Rhodospirillum centenum SW]
MIPAPVVIAVGLVYILLLFAIAYGADRRAAAGGPISGPYVYALSLAVFCTSWTFYGSVGRTATDGVGFLPIYLGPTLVMTLGLVLLTKILRIAHRQRSTSIADFIAARYGRSQLLGGLVALVAVVGITPYIALQLKAISVSFQVLTGGPAQAAPSVLADTGLWVALIMAAFAIMFGTRSIDASEHHPGLVTAVAFESLVKLLAFVAVGIAVVWGVFEGPADMVERALSDPETARLFTIEPAFGGGNWIAAMLLSMAAAICLPRQFQVMVVENTDERHLTRALWVFPLYLLLINLFVVPIALAGLLTLPRIGMDPDMMVLSLPLAAGWEVLAMAAFIGGLSAATGMIIVETVALATMVSNDLVLPLLLRWRQQSLSRVQDLGRLMLAVRRVAIVVLLLLGYLYFRAAGSAYALVSIGLISFAAVAQFAPALIGGLFWAGGTRRGALAGLGGGTLVWLYTLLLPSFARSGWLPVEFLEAPFGLDWLNPYELFGLQGMVPLAHSLFWSMVANIGLYVGVSVLDRPDRGERAQATAFVEVFQQEEPAGIWRGQATVGELQTLLARFLGPERSEQAFQEMAAGRQQPLSAGALADADLIRRAERLLAGAIGAASARVALASAVGRAEVGQPELLRMLDETSHVIEYSRRLEQKSAELERATEALSAANVRLMELDRMKDDFLSTVTHELRTPLTSVRALSEILYDTPELPEEQRQKFLATIIKESERLTRLINQVLDMAKIEAGEIDWHIASLDIAALAREAADSTRQLFRDKGVALELDLPEGNLPPALGDSDRLIQVMVNLLSNAVKFAPAEGGRVRLSLRPAPHALEVAVDDNGPGIAPEYHEAVFEKFRQVGSAKTGKPQGTGLGLAICRRLVDGMGGRIWVESTPGAGATFRFRIPAAVRQAAAPVLADGA